MSHDLALYRVFYTVAHHKNISSAATALYISQPAVSKSIKKLEDEVGLKLFSRSSKGVELTSEGQVFYTYIKKALHTIADGEQILQQLKNKEQGTITIGVSTTLCRYFLLPYLKPFICNYPEVKIKIVNKSTFDTLKHIDQGALDFGIVSYPFDAMHYNFIKLSTIQDIFVASNEYLKNINFTQANDIFTKCTFMLMEPDNITRQYFDQFCLKNDILINPEIEINNMDLLIDFAKIGLGVTVVIKEFITQELQAASLVEIPVIPAIPVRTVGIVSHKDKPLSIAAQTFLAYFTPLN
ncbi:MAG: LysR family transcriptional regulator [Pelosinus sp.]|nr:LysR family transcriptional regulator [Pelosinus sp.]